MVSTFSSNIQLEEPARGDDVGTWDTPVNANMTLVDRVVGAITTISLNNSPVVLAAGQFQSKQITFNSTLTGSVAITFPTSFTKSYEIQNLCTGSSAFIITLTTTAAGGQVICCPPGETFDCFNDGTNIKFKNFGRVGSYWDFAGSSIPGWVAGCTVRPYLNCDGTAFSSATYPALAAMIGTTLPDSRGRSRFATNQGIARVTAGISGIDGNTAFSAGGSESMQQHNHGTTDPTHFHGPNGGFTGGSALDLNINGLAGGAISQVVVNGNLRNTAAAATGLTINNNGVGAAQNMPPAYIGGLTFIRSA